MKPRVFVVQPIPEPALEMMREVADVEVYPYTDRMVTIDELICAARRSDYIYTMHETIITKAVVDANPELKGIVVSGRDYASMIDVAACEAAGVPIILGGGNVEARHLNGKATADLTIAMMLSLGYRLAEADVYTKAGGFRQEMTMELMGLGVIGKTAGVIGMGVVASHLVPRLQAFEMEVLYTKRNRLDPAEEEERGIVWANLDELLERSDYVIMLANYNDSTHELLGAREFALMKPRAYFVNTGRGRLIDEGALIEALQNKTIAGAGLDVFLNEPPVIHDPFVPFELRKMDNVVLAPHNGGATWDSRTLETSGPAEAVRRVIERNRSLVAT